LPSVSRNAKLAPNHRSNHGSKVSTFVAGVEAGDVFDEQPSASAVLSSSVNNSHCVEEKSTSCRCPIVTPESCALSGYRQVLARETADDQVDLAERGHLVIGNLRDIA
jgi:hypothetical protein